MKTKYGPKTRPVVSRSEAGNFKSYRDLDMKVLRRDANAAVEFFYGPRKSDREKCVFSVIDDGRLVSPGTERFKTVIRRWLQPITDRDGNTAIYLFYEDTGMGGGYDKPTQGPLCKIEEVRIRDGFLNIFGTRRGELVTFRYRIRENSDSFGYPQPVPEGQPRIDEYGTPKERPKAKPAPVPTAKAKTVPTPKPKKKKTPAEAPKPAKNGLSYEVRVGGAIKGVFTSKTKAEAHKKDLKAKGIPAKIVIVGY